MLLSGAEGSETMFLDKYLKPGWLYFVRPSCMDFSGASGLYVALL